MISVNLHHVARVHHADYDNTNDEEGCKSFTCATISDVNGNFVNVMLPYGARIVIRNAPEILHD